MGILKFGGKLLSNLVHKPATLNYPAEPRQYTDRTRGHIAFDPENCILCNICGKKCPTDAIHMDKAGRTLTIDRMLCIQCGYCVDSCPKKCLTMEAEYAQPDVSKTRDSFPVPEKPKEPQKAEGQ